MTDDRSVWDRAYEQRGQLWGGTVPRLPDLPDGARVLELGCGNGKTASALLQQGLDVVALDFSAAAARAARSGTPGPGSCPVLIADARALPFRASSFDAVIARHVIGHMDRNGREAIAREVGRVLTDGGVVHFSGFSTRDFRFAHGSIREEGTFLRGNGISTHYFTSEEVRTLFSGLAVVSLDISRWTLRIRGKDHERSEIHAIFRKDRA
jgi:ubiquinone/menaquinone biosynthesis C-methylase UbiE